MTTATGSPGFEARAPATRPPNQLKTVQVLRAVAALLVVIAHADPMISKLAPGNESVLRNLAKIGAFGVDIFFVISGAIMVIVSESLFGRTETRRRFVVQRLTRIFPPYWLYLTATLGLVILTGRLLDWGYVARSYALWPVLNTRGKLRPLLGVGWTLTYELYFYALFAFFLRLKKSHAIPFLGVTIVCVCAASRWLLDLTTALGLFLSDPIAIEFAAGALLGASFQWLRTLPRWLGPLGVALGVALVSRTNNVEDLASFRWWIWGGPAVLIVFGALVIDRTIPPRWPSLCVTLGDSSYSLYLLHPVLFSLIFSGARRIPNIASIPADIGILAAVTLAVVLAHYAYHRIELPLIRAARRAMNARDPRGRAATGVQRDVRGTSDSGSP